MCAEAWTGTWAAAKTPAWAGGSVVGWPGAKVQAWIAVWAIAWAEAQARAGELAMVPVCAAWWDLRMDMGSVLACGRTGD